MKHVRLFVLLIMLAGCSTPRRPATVTALPPTPAPITIATNQPATNPLLPPGFVPGTNAPRVLSVMSRAEPQTVTTPSLATISMLSGYVNIEWTAVIDDRLAGYIVYYGAETRQYTNLVSVGNVTNCTIQNLKVGGEYHFAVTAIDFQGVESDFSDELVLPKLWQVAEISFGPDDTNAVLESSIDLFNWSLRADSRHTTNNTWRVKLYDELPAEFYRSATYASPSFP